MLIYLIEFAKRTKQSGDFIRKLAAKWTNQLSIKMTTLEMQYKIYGQISGISPKRANWFATVNEPTHHGSPLVRLHSEHYEVLSRVTVPPLTELPSKRRLALFGHI